MASPLAGIRVLDVSSAIAAPAGAALMADLGADVIKVEPPGGDPFRIAANPLTQNHNLTFDLVQRGKRSLTVDLAQPRGREVIARVARTVDVFLTNLVPERQARYGVTFADLRAAKADIVHASFSGYGSRGPERDKLGYDYAAFWARGGIMSVLGEEGSPPPMGRAGLGDYPAAVSLLAAVLAALRVRDGTGEAQEVEVALQGVGIWAMASDYMNTMATGASPARVSRRAPINPLWNSYLCSDGAWVVLVNTRPFPDKWPRFCEMIGRPELATDPRANDIETLKANSAALTAEIEAEFAKRPVAHWGPEMDRRGIIWGLSATVPETIADPQAQAMGWFADVGNGERTQRVVNPPFKIWTAEVGARGLPPQAGEHTFDVLAEAGFSEAEVESLAQGGVVA